MAEVMRAATEALPASDTDVDEVLNIGGRGGPDLLHDATQNMSRPSARGRSADDRNRGDGALERPLVRGKEGAVSISWQSGPPGLL